MPKRNSLSTALLAISLTLIPATTSLAMGPGTLPNAQPEQEPELVLREFPRNELKEDHAFRNETYSRIGKEADSMLERFDRGELSFYSPANIPEKLSVPNSPGMDEPASIGPQ